VSFFKNRRFVDTGEAQRALRPQDVACFGGNIPSGHKRKIAAKIACQEKAINVKLSLSDSM
jgi:hypothetical protein